MLEWLLLVLVEQVVKEEGGGQDGGLRFGLSKDFF